MSSLGQMLRHAATFSLVYLLRLTNPITFLSSSCTTTTTTVLLATYIGVSVISCAEAAATDDKGTLSAGKLRSLGEVAMSGKSMFVFFYLFAFETHSTDIRYYVMRIFQKGDLMKQPNTTVRQYKSNQTKLQIITNYTVYINV